MAKSIDMTGQIYGLWKVLNKSDKRGADRSIMWECECLGCGSHHLINGSNLRNGHSSKGCRSCISSQKRHGKDITGQKFGLLTALEATPERKFNQVVWKCQCDCGSITYVPLGSLTSGSTQSCGCLVSKGEKKIEELLTQANIFFETQKKFIDCKDKDYLRFDFYVNNEYLIEYDGVQHFQWGGCWNGDNKSDVQRRDNIKNTYCRENNIPLIRIPYWKLETLTLEDLLLSTTKYILREPAEATLD